jgi:signal transduction histidine kinase
MMKNISIRNQLLLAFTFFTLIIVFLSSASIWYLRKGEDIRTVKTLIDQIHLNTLSLIKYDMGFFSHEMINESFYQVGESERLSNRKALISDIRENLLQLQSEKEIVEFELGNQLKNIDSLIESYDSTFSLIVKKTLVRGFKEFGLQGEMRRYARELEEPGSGISVEMAREIRKYEMDYFLRLDQIYVDELNTISGDLLGKMNIDSEKNHSAIHLLVSYTEVFNRLVMISRELGVEDNRGLKKELENLSEYIATEFDAVSTETSENVDQTLNKVEIAYYTMVFICLILSIILSYLLAVALSKPIRHLAKHLDKVIEQDFEGEAKIQISSNTLEVNKLAQSYDNMLKRIKWQFGIIKENAKALDIQNAELKKINSKLRSSEKKLTETNQVKDKFFSIIAHDLKGPIATQASFLNTLIKHIDSFTKEETKFLAKEIYASVNNLSTLLENLLEWSRSQMGLKDFRPEKINLEKVVWRNVELMKPRANEKEIVLSHEIDPNLFVYADENMVNFIVRNLMSNALKFTKKGGEVKVQSKTLEDGIVEIAVTDTGIGIEPEELKKLFQVGNKVSRPGTANEKGTGLGLMLCREFVEMQDGRIWVDSELGKGTTFLFTLKQTASQEMFKEEKVESE